MPKKANLRAALLHYGQLMLGAAILAFGLFNIHSRCGITEGGVLGMTLLLQHWLGLTPGITGFILDGLCYFFGYRLLGKAFLKNAVAASLSFSLFYNIFERIGYCFPDLSAMPLLAALAGSAFVGVGVGIVVREGGASGGDDALALIISKLSGCRISLAYFCTDFVVLCLSLTYIPIKRIAFSLITVTLSSLIIEFLQKLGKGGAKAGAQETGTGAAAPAAPAAPEE